MNAKGEQYHQRCYELASKGMGLVAPNPMVGAIVVFNNQIIGEGFHAKYGGPHAEVNAINSVVNKSLLTKSTLYVNLEPCSHTGKTPPCADLIINCKIPRVVIGHRDPFEKVAGRGIEKLRAAGIEVSVGNFEEAYRFLNRRFLTFHEKKRPYIILKWAETADGFVDIVRTKNHTAGPNWITDKITRALVHKWRTEEQAILVGTNTALFDNPFLNARDWSGPNPVRMVPDMHLRLPGQLHIFDQKIPTVVFTENPGQSKPNLSYVRSSYKSLIPDILTYCYEHQYLSLFVEGGAKLLQSFIEHGLWDEARVFTGKSFFGQGVSAPKLNLVPEKSELLGDTMLNIYYK